MFSKTCIPKMKTGDLINCLKGNIVAKSRKLFPFQDDGDIQLGIVLGQNVVLVITLHLLCIYLMFMFHHRRAGNPLQIRLAIFFEIR